MAGSGESVVAGRSCDRDAPRRAYEVVALAVDITLNRYLDHDPQGRMYALASQVDAVRAEEAANAAARAGRGNAAVSVGLQGDVIQPLTLRVLPGECLVIRLDNRLDGEPASLHLHGSSLRVAATGAAATAANPDATATPGSAVTYEWMVPADQPEATHYFHSHGEERPQTNHGLFGALVVEPAGSTWTDPLTGEPTQSGWQAVIHPAAGPAFREFALYYHEIGNEDERLLNGDDRLVPVVDPLTSAYRPGARALNYRSEPFMNRLALGQAVTGVVDESLEYSSYSFGDPATPMLRAYLGDPIKQRVVHGGSEVFHVHHVHGGTTRWPRQPGVEGTVFASGLDKQPAQVPPVTERTDAQTLGPSETFDVAAECAAGGCQQVPGDFMFHCHVAHHYFAGMWGIARTYNTLQDGASSTDALPPLSPLPGAADAVVPAVASDALVGTTLESPDGKLEVTSETLAGLVEPQLPPQGVPAAGDASVFDWVRQGDRYLNEPETDASWPGYSPVEPGVRPPLAFDARTGRLAYPILRPHLAKRPPFAPGHGPAPFLDPAGSQRDPPPPGASGPTSVCPAGTRPRAFAINAIRVPILLNAQASILDPNGMLYVLRSQRDRVREDRDLQVPLALRTNAGEDCVDVLLRSELRDDPGTAFSKVGIHIHFVQFDVQGSDGVNVGFNYEQTVRPYTAEGATLVAPAAAGGRVLRVGDASRLRPGALVGVGMDRDETFEVARVQAVDGAVLHLAEPLRFEHDTGEWVSSEFVRYRWYPDVQFGTAYFHDHVDALSTWRHGLFGALVAEPPGATWTDPVTGQPLASGPIADVHTDQPVGHDVAGSFRELLLFTQDDNPLTRVRRSLGGTFNLRAEPLHRRAGPPQLVFSSAEHGDPDTPVLRAHLGDPVVIRDLVGAANEVHTLRVDGHWFRAERFSSTSPPISTIDLGISERYDLVIPAAGGPQRMPGDYLYLSGRAVKLEEGNWGLIRVLEPDASGLRPLPRDGPAPAPTRVTCPPDAPVRRFDVAALDAPLPMLGRAPGRVFTTQDAADAVAAGKRPAEPLVLRATVGDCIEVVLANRLAEGRVSFHTDLLARDPSTSAGIAAGREPDQSVAPGETRTYTLHASEEVGETVVLVRDGADVLTNPGRGLYGAIVVAAAGSRFLDPASGEELGGRTSWRANVVPPQGHAYRDFVLFLQDQDASIGGHRMPYTVAVEGTIGVNYRTEPLRGRSIAQAAADGVSTPLLEAVAGDPVRLHVLVPWSEQSRVFAVEGHQWPQEPGRPGTPLLSSRRIGGLQALTLHLGSAGGPDRLPGDYLYGDHRVPYEEAGAWGLFRIRAKAGEDLPALPGRGRSGRASGPVALWAALAFLVAVEIVVRRPRQKTTNSAALEEPPV
ncbi:MAG: multicopper oxidase domain-containing protein [Actinomycetota bacterium]|nr:multicopper oxidase domain-containing protein [Actinomycetota bacterium]